MAEKALFMYMYRNALAEGLGSPNPTILKMMVMKLFEV